MAPVSVTLLQAAAFVPLAIPAGVDVLYDLAGLQLNIHVLMSLSGGLKRTNTTATTSGSGRRRGLPRIIRSKNTTSDYVGH